MQRCTPASCILCVRVVVMGLSILMCRCMYRAQWMKPCIGLCITLRKVMWPIQLLCHSAYIRYFSFTQSVLYLIILGPYVRLISTWPEAEQLTPGPVLSVWKRMKVVQTLNTLSRLCAIIYKVQQMSLLGDTTQCRHCVKTIREMCQHASLAS